MSKIKTLIKCISDSQTRFAALTARGFYNNLSDEEYLRRKFKLFFNRELDLDNPKTFCEKLQWLKLYDRKPVYTQMVDKYAVKEYVSKQIGDEYVIPLLGVWDSFDEIDFDILPEQFILKATHNSGGFIVCKNKKTFDYRSAGKMFKKCLQKNYFFEGGREWPYKDVPPRIIAEKYIDTLGKPDSVEYKLTCFDGKVGFVTVCRGIAHTDFEKRSNDSFDVDFNHMPWYAYYQNAKVDIQKPEQWEEMIRLAEILSKDIPEVRIDFYLIDGKVYFGEITFYTWSGFIEFTPPEWDRILGDMITLPQKSHY